MIRWEIGIGRDVLGCGRSQCARDRANENSMNIFLRKCLCIIVLVIFQRDTIILHFGNTRLEAVCKIEIKQL